MSVSMVFQLPAPDFIKISERVLDMEYNFIADLLAKFVICSDFIKAAIIIDIGIISVSLFYFIKQTITESIRLIRISSSCD
ncbi:hypothetical protein [Candidatus Trichorickettsia mobilis]|uniref:hypothetical protein n=1 Tax=Candidatus Trichorickettsia mobilis TaxID=1346319 RepID=UPI00292DF192|nr:hypothetical protein [Candidatus Trichorickettsia mobilis]